MCFFYIFPAEIFSFFLDIFLLSSSRANRGVCFLTSFPMEEFIYASQTKCMPMSKCNNQTTTSRVPGHGILVPDMTKQNETKHGFNQQLIQNER